MLVLDNIRQEFAKFLSEDPSGRWRMDAALAHVVMMAYQRGIEDGKKQTEPVHAALSSVGKRRQFLKTVEAA